MILIVDNKEYKFTTYNNSKIKKLSINDKVVEITLKKDDYYLDITSSIDNSHKLTAPIKGKMKKDIKESISSDIKVKLKKKDKVIFKGTSTNCGLEIV